MKVVKKPKTHNKNTNLGWTVTCLKLVGKEVATDLRQTGNFRLIIGTM